MDMPNLPAPVTQPAPARILRLGVNILDTPTDTAYARDIDHAPFMTAPGNRGQDVTAPHNIAVYGFSPITFTSGNPRPLPFVNKIIDPVALRATSAEVAKLRQLIANAQRAHNALDTFANALKAEMKRGAFTFTKLPGELRNRIYRYALANEIDYSINLRSFKLPALTQASRQLRAETIPLFFSECAFYVEIESNFQDRKSARTNTPQVYANPANFGRLRLPAERKVWLRGMAKEALIKDITICVVASKTSRWSPLNNRTTSHVRLFVAPQGNLEVDIRDGLDHPSARRRTYFDHDKEDVDAAVAEVRKKAEEIAAGKGKGKEVKGKKAADDEVKGFPGLDWQDIERIAQQLRFKMPKATNSET